MPRHRKGRTGERQLNGAHPGHDDPFSFGLFHVQDPGIKRPGKKYDARTYYLKGLSHEERGEHALAIRDYDKAIRLDPQLAWAYYHRAIACGNAGDRSGWAEDLRAAARLGLRIAIEMLASSGDTHKKSGDTT